MKIRPLGSGFATVQFIMMMLLVSPFQSCKPKSGKNENTVVLANQKNLKLNFRNDSIFRRPNFEGDNWHTTYASDGNQYVLQCDGQGYNTQMWRLIGSPESFKFEAVTSHPGPKEKPRERYYGFGILAVGPSIYHFMSTPDKWYFDPP